MFMQSNKHTPQGIFVTDLDGTLLCSDGTLADIDLQALKRLGQRGIVRVVATGRSIYSFTQAVNGDLPVDYVIFSTGAGIIKYPEGIVLRKVNLESEAVDRAVRVLIAAKLDFMIHRPIPDNHMFAYWWTGNTNPDFTHRLENYKGLCWSLDKNASGFGRAAQLLAVLPYSEPGPILDAIRCKLPDMNVIRTTSPLNGYSTWIEIFPPNVSKSFMVAWLANMLGIDPLSSLSIGNDYNDIDLLEWAADSFVVENAPNDLKERFSKVASNDRGGVAEAIEKWLEACKTVHI